MLRPAARRSRRARISLAAAPLRNSTSATLIRENHLEVFRFVLKAGKATPEHIAAGALTIQCIEGEVELVCCGQTQLLKANTLVYLKENDAHTVKALADSTLLITILLKRE